MDSPWFFMTNSSSWILLPTQGSSLLLSCVRWNYILRLEENNKGFAALIKVIFEWHVLTPFPVDFKLPWPIEGKQVVSFAYENLPMFCFILGHHVGKMP